MATLAQRGAGTRSTRFYLIMALVMAGTIIAGFTFHLAMGRSSFSEPVTVHFHGMVFMAWTGFYMLQAVTIAGGNVKLHRQLGQLAYVFIPVMLIAGTMVMAHSAQTRGGPFFFAMNEFVISNTMLLYTFGGLALWALRVRRHQGWHRRLMLVAMSILTGPGLGRLLPMPLFMPYAWTTSILLTFLFPMIGMIADKRRLGRVHPAWWWGLGIYAGVFVFSMLLAYSSLGYALTQWVVTGTPGAERPMEAFLPPGFAM
jgi:hypothetical protein